MLSVERPLNDLDWNNNCNTALNKDLSVSFRVIISISSLFVFFLYITFKKYVEVYVGCMFFPLYAGSS